MPRSHPPASAGSLTSAASPTSPRPAARPGARLLPVALLAFVVAAAGLVRGEPTARQIVDAARRAHGVAALDTTPVSFGFRGDTYHVSALGGPRTIVRTRTLADSLGGGRVAEALRPDGTVHRRAWTHAPGPVPLVRDDTLRDELLRGELLRGDDAARVASSIGSVVYFALLPHGLADASVRLRRLPDDRLRGRPVRTVEVTFDSTGGGRSWRDRYVYWIDAARATVDAFAYDYEDGDGTTRLRLATRVRTVGGVRFQDYATFTDDGLKGRIEQYLTRIGTPTLRPVSTVAFDTVAVGGAVRWPPLP